MSKFKDKIIVIPNKDLPKLRDLFINSNSMHFMAQGIVQNYIRWMNDDPEYKKDAEFYSLNGDWSDGTFAVLTKSTLFCYTMREGENLNRLNQLVKLLPTENYVLCYGINVKHIAAIRNAFLIKRYKENYHLNCFNMHLLRDKAEQLETPDLPEGLIFKDLSVDAIPRVRANYALGDCLPRDHFELVMRRNPNVGVFDESTGELMGWCFKHQTGILHALEVEDKHRGKGLAELIVKHMVKKIVALGEEVYATVEPQNTASMKVFEKIGFYNSGQEFIWTEFKQTEVYY